MSGSYGEKGAGTPARLWVCARDGGSLAAPRAVLGTDGAALAVTSLPGDDGNSDVLCLRPAAADLDADGKLDLVVGTWIGTFAWFRGAGNGTFAPKNGWLEAEGAPLRVDDHGDPCLADWDGDG